MKVKPAELRTLALLIDNVDATRSVKIDRLGVTWTPGCGRKGAWSEKKAKAVLGHLITFGYAEVSEGWFGHVVRLTQLGRALLLSEGYPLVADLI